LRKHTNAILFLTTRSFQKRHYINKFDLCSRTQITPAADGKIAFARKISGEKGVKETRVELDQIDRVSPAGNQK